MGLDLAWRDFTYTVLLPLFSAVCTAPEEDVLQHPVEEFLGWLNFFTPVNFVLIISTNADYIWLTLGTHHYVALYGVQDVVSRLTANVRHIHLSSTISAISPDQTDSSLASIHCDTPTGPIVYSGFHHIIFATQATRAVPLVSSFASSLPLKDPKRIAVEKQVQCLKTFEYRATVVINHTDGTLLPDNEGDRRELNLICAEPVTNTKFCKEMNHPNTLPPSYTMATHILTPPKGYPAHLPGIYQTTNPIVAPREDCIFSVAKLERAVVTVNSKTALKGLYEEEGRQWWQVASQGTSRLGELQGAGKLMGAEGPGIWICGSFAYAGIPLLEGCVVSARTVVEQGIWKSEGIDAKDSPW